MNALRLGLSYLGGGGASSLAPAITDFIIKDITDVAMTIEANVNPNGDSTAVSIFNGATEIPLTTIPAGNNPVLISYTITGLLPYTNYLIHIEAVNTVGSNSTVTLTRNTLEPVELTDGNWYAMWDVNYADNVSVSNLGGNIVELRDTRFDGALSEELIPDPEFNDPTKWGGLGETIVMEDGKLKYNASSGTVSSSMPTASSIGLGLIKIELKGGVITSGRVLPKFSSGDNFIAGRVAVGISTSGDYIEVHEITNNIGHFYILPFDTPITAEFESLSVKSILGNHCYRTAVTMYKVPLKLPENDFARFEGKRHLISHNVGIIGTVYAIVQRDGVDTEFVIRNNLDLIGALESNGVRLHIGRNPVTSTNYAFNLKKLWIRTITDSAEVIAKLNEWISRESYELPEVGEGVLATGVWNDAALWSDDALWNDGI